MRRDDRVYLYYTGWSRGVSVPFYLNIGLAISAQDGRFHRVSAAPLLDRIVLDPYLNASPWVLVEANVWRMWYVSGTGWETINGQPRHNYHIKYAESSDGLHWIRTGAVAIDYGEGEYAFGRPCVMHDRDAARYRMWFSVRGDAYRLGYAESVDGITSGAGRPAGTSTVISLRLGFGDDYLSGRVRGRRDASDAVQR